MKIRMGDNALPHHDERSGSVDTETVKEFLGLYNSKIPKPLPREKVTAEVLEQVEARLRAARTKMLFHGNWMAFSMLSMHLKLHIVHGLGTCATDGEHFLYDPAALAPETIDYMEFDWAHEVLHLFGMDLSRAPIKDIIVQDGAGNPVKLWNLACDLYNNLLLEGEGFTIPPFVPIDRSYKGMTKDEIYEDLKKKVKANGPGCVPQGRGCGGFVKKPGKSKGKGDPKDKNGKPAEGDAKDFENWKPSKGDEEKWKARAKEALDAARAKGDAPAFLETAIKELLKPRVPWKDILWAFCTRSAKEWRYRPPSRTGAARGIVLPRLCPEDEIEHGLFVFDTSGSIDDSELQEFLTELEAILRTIRMKATVLMVDAQVHEPVYEFEPGDFDWTSLKFLGRGGTAFEPAFDWVEAKGEKPTFMIYFTDTYGSFPEQPPEYPVLWAVTHPNGEVPWGQYLSLKEKAV